jgi:hypothetical protein
VTCQGKSPHDGHPGAARSRSDIFLQTFDSGCGGNIECRAAAGVGAAGQCGFADPAGERSPCAGSFADR